MPARHVTRPARRRPPSNSSDSITQQHSLLPLPMPTIDNVVAPVMAPTDSGDINELFQLTLFCEKWEMKWFLPRMGLFFYVETYQVFYVVPTRPFFKLWAFLILFQVETCWWRSLVFWLALALSASKKNITLVLLCKVQCTLSCVFRVLLIKMLFS